jgi:uncharacterized protein YutE (UPF0331/DUF86 family)
VLRRVSNDLEELRDYQSVPSDELLDNRERLGNIKYLLITAIEGCIDAAQHACASERWGPPDDNASAMRVLAEHGVMERDLADAMVNAVGLRNVLVHEYRDVDDKRVLESLQRLTDIDRFVESLSRLA